MQGSNMGTKAFVPLIHRAPYLAARRRSPPRPQQRAIAARRVRSAGNTGINRVRPLVGDPFRPPNFGRRVWRSASSEMNKFTDLDSYSIEEFCRRHSISVAMYYKLRQQKVTPREMRLGVRVLISREAAARWRSEREAASGS
jgi:hypothetical protein